MKSFRKELWFSLPTRRGFVNITYESTAKTFFTAKSAKNIKKFFKIIKNRTKTLKKAFVILIFSSRPSPLRGRETFLQWTHVLHLVFSLILFFSWTTCQPTGICR